MANLVTGGSGFTSLALLRYLIWKTNHQRKVVTLKKLTHAEHSEYLQPAKDSVRLERLSRLPGMVLPLLITSFSHSYNPC